MTFITVSRFIFKILLFSLFCIVKFKQALSFVTHIFLHFLHALASYFLSKGPAPKLHEDFSNLYFQKKNFLATFGNSSFS